MTSARVCFPLLPAVDDAAFVYSLLLVFGSCSVPVSLNSCGADAAVVFLMSHSFLCNSSGNATCISSLLRSNLSLPCGGILRALFKWIRQRSEWACAIVLSLIALQRGDPPVAPNFSMSCPVILSLWIRAPSDGNGGIGIGSTRMSGLSTVHLPSVILSTYSDYVLDGFFVPSAPRFQSSDSRSSAYTVCNPNETFCTVIPHSKPNFEFVSQIHSVHGINGNLPRQHSLTKRDKLLCRFLAMQSFECWSPVTTFLTCGQDASCMFHPTTAEKVIRH